MKHLLNTEQNRDIFFLSVLSTKLSIRIITTEIRRQSVQFIPTAYVWVAPGTAIIHGQGGQIPPPLRKERQRQVETKITSQKYRRGAGGGGRGEFTQNSCTF